MNYTTWLKEQGIRFDPGELTEVKAAQLAEPVADPGTPLIEVKGLVVHHSATVSGSAGCFRVLHRGINHWNDIGYHFVIGNGTHSGNGQVEEGRRVPRRGAHARGANHDTLGICLVGNFNETKPSREQMEALGELLRQLMCSWDLLPSGITLHRLVKGSSTECPGKRLTLEEIWEYVDK